MVPPSGRTGTGGGCSGIVAECFGEGWGGVAYGVGCGGEEERMRFARSKTGKTVHLVECRHARVSWVWTEGRRLSEIAEVMWRMGYRECQVCRPLRWA